jgi:integrase
MLSKQTTEEGAFVAIEKRKRKDGSTAWVYRWHEGRRYRAKVFDTKRAAELFEAEIRRRRQMGSLGLDEGGRRTIDDLHSAWWEVHSPGIAPATRRSYEGAWRSLIEPRLGGLRLSQLTTRRIEEFVHGLLAEGVGEASAEKAWVVLSAMLGRAQAWGWIGTSPMVAARKPRKRGTRRVPGALVPREVEAVRSSMAQRDAAMVSVLAYVGLRPGELLALRWEDVGDAGIRVERAASLGEVKSTKTRRTRVARLPATVSEDLAAWRLACDGDLVFPGRDGGVWSEDEWRRWRRGAFARAVRAAGLPAGVRPYDLRHSAASLMIHEGRNIVEVAGWLGHDPATCLSTYSHLIAELAGRDPVPMEEMVRLARQASTARPLGASGHSSR